MSHLFTKKLRFSFCLKPIENFLCNLEQYLLMAAPRMSSGVFSCFAAEQTARGKCINWAEEGWKERRGGTPGRTQLHGTAGWYNIQWIIFSSLSIISYTVYIIQRILYSVYLTVHIIQCILWKEAWMRVSHSLCQLVVPCCLTDTTVPSHLFISWANWHTWIGNTE